MIPSDDNLDRVVLPFQPIQLLLYTLHGAIICQIAGVYQDVSVGDVDGLIVGIGDGYHADGRSIARWMEGVAAQEQDELVEDCDEQGQWGGEEVVEERHGLPGVAATEADEAEEAHCCYWREESRRDEAELERSR